MVVIYEKQAIKALRKMPQKTAKAIMAKIEAFAAEGMNAHVDVTTLKGTDNGYRIRQGDWRALIYKRDDSLIVTAIKPRGDAYK